MTVNQLLQHGLSGLQLRLFHGILEQLVHGYEQWEGMIPGDKEHPALPLITFLANTIREQLEVINKLRADFAAFNSYYSRSITDQERRQHIINYARVLGANRKQLKQDRRALNRWLGQDAMQERCLVRVSLAERQICFCLDRITILLEFLSDSALLIWQRLDPLDLTAALLDFNGDNKVTAQTLRALGRALLLLPPQQRRASIGDDILQRVYRYSMEEKQPVRVHSEALHLLSLVDSDSFIKILKVKLQDTGLGDAIFIRRSSLRAIAGDLELSRESSHISRLEDLLPPVSQDPSPFVRQELARVICLASHTLFNDLSRYLALEDPSPQVRAQMLLELSELMKQGKETAYVSRLLTKSIASESHPFVLKVAIKVIDDCAHKMMEVPGSSTLMWIKEMAVVLQSLQCTALVPAVRRRAARTVQRLWLLQYPKARELKEFLTPIVNRIRPGESKLIPRSRLEGYDSQTLGRVLAVLADEDFSLSLHRGGLLRHWVEIQRGPEFRFRLWRLLHEFKHPSPDKRQAFPHTRGRYIHGQIHAPSPLLAELTETRVPGEPLVFPEEEGWRPFLPLVDHLLSALKILGPAPTQFIYTGDGITEFSPPPGLLQRIVARFILTFRFRRFAALRNRQESNQEAPDSYLKELDRLGFRFTFHPYPFPNMEETGSTPCVDPSVKRFFPSLFIPLPDLFNQLKNYFVSIYENSFLELIIFTSAAIVIFIGRQLYLNARHRKLRKQIPLVIGGWGTRGKSGTERLKAALINAQGFGVVSKTTGSEATFLHAWPHGKLYEIPLFRPYDKATIWEQQDITRIAGNLGTEVLLWECMALQPDYVRVLQKNWMRDDLSTITNAYPDHEDVMGPAGINIPTVMAHFIPEHGTLFTSEEQMLPILREASAAAGSDFKSVGWLEAGLLTPDVLARFPYNEHPYNIALVLALAEQLGIDPDTALKEMADRVVAEIGMLKTYPQSLVNSRKLEFTNGMAANERVGFLSNWQRMGFDSQDNETEPGVWISTLVNNRADRIPRSKVFAGILVRDISADRHFLIGSNLTGLNGYIKEAWEEYSAGLTLKSDTKSIDPQGYARSLLDSMARRMRIPLKEGLIKARLEVMLATVLPDGLDMAEVSGLWEKPEKIKETLTAAAVIPEYTESIVATLESDLTSVEQYRQFLARIDATGANELARLDEEFHRLLWSWFEKKVVTIWDFHATGDAVVRQISHATPPGFLNRVMGIQNIKGTGFDFVGKWQAWEQCSRALGLINSDDESEVEKGLTDLAAFTGYGLLCENAVNTVLPSFKASTMAQNERFQAQLQIIRGQFEHSIQRVKEQLGQVSRHRGGVKGLLDWLEGFLDAGDAVKRKKQAERIYQDLVQQRISHPRAIYELGRLNKRQKGGWLSTQLRSALKVFSR